jgi:hypothetical protein
MQPSSERHVLQTSDLTRRITPHQLTSHALSHERTRRTRHFCSSSISIAMTTTFVPLGAAADNGDADEARAIWQIHGDIHQGIVFAFAVVIELTDHLELSQLVLGFQNKA